MVDPVRRSVTSQVQEPEDEVTGVAAFELAGLVVSVLLKQAGLVCGAAFCCNKSKKIQKKATVDTYSTNLSLHYFRLEYYQST